jgi:hypothetical protein
MNDKLIRSRRDISKEIDRVRMQIHQLDIGETIFLKMGEENFYRETVAKLNNLMERLEEEYEKTPAGHLYRGVYYRKCQKWQKKDKTIGSPAEFIKKEGVIFLAGHLVSWDELSYSDPYSKNLFKEENEDSLIMRDDCEEVFDVTEINQLKREREQKMREAFRASQREINFGYSSGLRPS